MKSQWVRILITSLVVEVLYAAILFLIPSSWNVGYSISGFISLFTFLFAGGYWVGLNSKSKFKSSLDGALVGVAGIIYWVAFVAVSIMLGIDNEPENVSLPLVLLFNVIKIIAGALGGYVAFFSKK